MKLKTLIEKLQKIEKEYDGDFEITIDATAYNLFYLQKVYVGSMWNVVLSVDEEAPDVDDFRIEKPENF